MDHLSPLLLHSLFAAPLCWQHLVPETDIETLPLTTDGRIQLSVFGTRTVFIAATPRGSPLIFNKRGSGRTGWSLLCSGYLWSFTDLIECIGKPSNHRRNSLCRLILETRPCRVIKNGERGNSPVGRCSFDLWSFPVVIECTGNSSSHRGNSLYRLLLETVPPSH